MKIQIDDADLTELIETGHNTRFKRLERNGNLGRVYRVLETVNDTSGLRPYSFLHYEQLKDTGGLSSVRIRNGRVERLIFRD